MYEYCIVDHSAKRKTDLFTLKRLQIINAEQIISFCATELQQDDITEIRLLIITVL